MSKTRILKLRRARRRRWPLVFALACALTTPPKASAQAGEVSAPGSPIRQARALFAEGVRLLEAGRHAEAADAFERSLARHPSAETRYNLSSALAELGRVREALAMLDEVVADPDARRPVQKAAETRRRELAPRLAQLVIRSERAEALASVSVDGVALPQERWGSDVPVDPGPHEVRAMPAPRIRGPAPPPIIRHVQVAAGQRVEVWLVVDAHTLTVPPVPENTGRSAVAVAVTPAPVPRAGSRVSWWWWGAGAAVAATLAGVAAVYASGPAPFRGNGAHLPIGDR